jgi:hypothetical protein
MFAWLELQALERTIEVIDDSSVIAIDENLRLTRRNLQSQGRAIVVVPAAVIVRRRVPVVRVPGIVDVGSVVVRRSDAHADDD